MTKEHSDKGTPGLPYAEYMSVWCVYAYLYFTQNYRNTFPSNFSHFRNDYPWDNTVADSYSVMDATNIKRSGNIRIMITQVGWKWSLYYLLIFF